MQTLNSNYLNQKAMELKQANAEVKESLYSQVIKEEGHSSEKEKSAEKKGEGHEVNSNIKSLLANTMSI